MLCAFLCFTGIDACAKALSATLPTFEIVFFRYLGHLAIVSAVFLPSQGVGLWKANRTTVQIIRAVMLMASTALNFMAVAYLPLAVTSAIFFLAPLMICALSVPFLGEHVGPRRWAAIVIGFIGVMIIVRPGAGELHWAWMLSVGATLCASSYMMLTRVLAGEDTTETSQFYASIIPACVMLPLAAWVWVWPSGWLEITLVCIIGCFGWAGHQFATIAHRMAPASTLAPFVYTQILWMTGAGYLFLNTVPDIWVYVGAVIVIASGLYVWVRERQLAHTETALQNPTN